jgi:pre-mRNA-splicing factor 18
MFWVVDDGQNLEEGMPRILMVSYMYHRVVLLRQQPTFFTGSTTGLYTDFIGYSRLAMDFASLMSKEISKASEAAPKKYLKRAEVEAEREAAYLASQKALQAEREEKTERKRKLEEEEAARSREREMKRMRLAEESRRRREEEEERKERARRKRLGLPDLPPVGADRGETPLLEGEEDIPEADLIAQLRRLNEPARLFGESHKSRLRRYRRLIQPTATESSQTLTQGPIPTTLLPVPESDMKLPSTLPTAPTDLAFLYRQLASYFTLILTEWEIALAKRPESVKASFQGKQAYTAMVQARENMRPLFRRFERGDLEDGVLAPVVEIVRAAQERRYVDANDGYLTLSIGKA